MHNAIMTKYCGPTDRRGSRIRASDANGNSVYSVYQSDLDNDANHRRAAVALCRKMKWDGPLAGGAIKGGYVFVFTKGTVFDFNE